ncbi:NAD(FAD)-utilizing dehydrogenase [Pontibacillus halophilus JSM 076056 = DSM 19796]|uniref:NAD(FAD)-utilizing dehydrogenase n=1 Tax=Pontibacillus halophilus JSM 076056 = DSM 19796 TaxID=1385510 RepID=A0A0A5GCM5_9BACI|nr:NAD(FAD)-utilizing dehydrogenase [Pontibacillus halophilus]KGX90936.1 NAD(FAD)-utilizing dehydrogenase [Pontibacillus halophilus JSM 076056 = DSM 19796]
MNDITIIGAGVSSVFLADRLIEENPELAIHIIDKGKPLHLRHCGLDKGDMCTCEGECHKYIGFAGLGKSEGKFNYTNDFGGELGRKIGNDAALQYMKEVDNVLCHYGADVVPMYSTENEALSKRAEAHSLQVRSADVRHLGTRVANEVFQNMYDALAPHVTFSFETEVDTILPLHDGFKLITSDGSHSKTRKVVIGTGKSGHAWLEKQKQALNLTQGEARLDLGLRIEMKGDQLQSILTDTFETKLTYVGETFTGTTYCMNPKGRIIRKHQFGLVMPDGQNVKEKPTPTENLNFTWFVPKYFHSSQDALSYAQGIIGEINGNSNRIVVQRLEDLVKERKTTTLSSTTIVPSLHAEAGDLRNEIPGFYLDATLEMLQALERLIEEPIHGDTLLYGIDAKFYEPKVKTNDWFETEVPGLYLIGDCSGETHSLSQAAASGRYVGEWLSKQLMNDVSSVLVENQNDCIAKSNGTSS